MKKELCLPNKSYHSKIIERLVSSLTGGININQCKDTDRAVELATYLYAINDYKVAVELLKSFAYDITYSEKSGVWGSKQNAMALLAYSVLRQGLEAEAKEILIEIFESNPNIHTDETEWIIEDASEDITYYEPKDNWPVDLELTNKEITLGHYSTLAQFTFPYLVSKVIRKDDKRIYEPFSEIINTELQYLQEELKND